MRIGLLTTSYPRSPGDPSGGFVAEHARFLAGAGHHVEVIAAGTAGAPPWTSRGAAGLEWCQVDEAPQPSTASATATSSSAAAATTSGAGSLRVAWLPAAAGLFDGAGAPEQLARSGRAWLAAAGFSLAMVRAVAARARGWDAIVAHWLVPGALAALMAAPSRPLLAIAHSGDVHLLRRLRGLRAVGLLCARPHVRLSFVSEELRRMFLERAPGRAGQTQVCPMGIDVARLRAARSGRGPAAPGAEPTVLFLGRLVPVKGVDVLVRAALAWRSRARLVIAGAGPAEQTLRALAAGAPAGRIQFVGQLRAGERDRALAAADLVALPSVRVEGGRSEGLPVVALEAMAAGAALVASSVGGLAELAPAAVTRVEPGDPAALAAAVDSLALDPARRAVQVAAQDRLVPGFDWSAIGPRLVPPARERVGREQSSIDSTR